MHSIGTMHGEPLRMFGMQVYSFGVTVWQIMERKRPFEGLEPYQVMLHVVAVCWKPLLKELMMAMLTSASLYTAPCFPSMHQL